MGVTMELLPHPVTGQPFPSPVPPGTGWPEDPALPDTGDLEADLKLVLRATVAELVDAAAKRLTPETRQTVNSEILEALGPNGVLINVGRAYALVSPPRTAEPPLLPVNG